MLNFNENVYNQSITALGLKAAEIYPYKELLTSEISYQNHFLNFLKDDDINSLLAVNDPQQTDLSEIYRCLKALREQQREIIEELYRPHPEKWLQALKKVVPCYERYLNLTVGLIVSAKMDVAFKAIQEAKVAEHHPQLGGLSAVLIAPVQRFPRYYLLGRELLKALDKKTESDEKLEQFKQAIGRFVEGIRHINEQMNDMMIPPEEKDDEPTSPYLQPSARLHPMRGLKRARP
jgi:hypothetical protein